MPNLHRMAALLAALACFGACHGEIGPASSGAGSGGAGSGANGPGPSSGSGGEPSSSGTGGASGASGASGGSGTNEPPQGTDPGRVTLHRLNRVEYNNTVRDLLGTSLRPADNFPVDDRGGGFDNMADVLTLSSTQLSLYRQGAADLVADALANATLRSKLIPCDVAKDGVACARSTLEAFTPRAYRRPVSQAEVDRLMTLVTLATGKGDTTEQGLGLALQAVLLSPSFLFRVELDPTATSTTAHPLDGYELASRLSYFLWSTMPDDQLMAAAAAGTLSDSANLKAQVVRMLASPKAQALVDNFAGQWLAIRAVQEVTPDPTAFPKFDDKLRAAMAGETGLFFQDFVAGKLSGDQLLTADYTYLNDRLATHYGLPAVGSTSLVKKSLTGNAMRGGILGQASILTVTSHPSRTSPVVRGKYVLTQLLCQDVPPPPPDVDVSSLDAATATGSLRQRLEAHRANPSCSSCHSLMDPLGFGLDNYDAIGAYRTMDGADAIDATGVLPDKRQFSGMRELAQLIAADPAYASCFASKLYSYALGRLPESGRDHLDPWTLYQLAQRYRQNGMRFPDMVSDLVSSRTFLERRGEPEAP